MRIFDYGEADLYIVYAGFACCESFQDVDSAYVGYCCQSSFIGTFLGYVGGKEDVTYDRAWAYQLYDSYYISRIGLIESVEFAI